MQLQLLGFSKHRMLLLSWMEHMMLLLAPLLLGPVLAMAPPPLRPTETPFTVWNTPPPSAPYILSSETNQPAVDIIQQSENITNLSESYISTPTRNLSTPSTTSFPPTPIAIAVTPTTTSTTSSTTPTTSSTHDLLGPHHHRMIAEFSFPHFNLGPITSPYEEDQSASASDSVSLRLSAPRERVEVGRIDPNLQTQLNLLEHILLRMDFNYLDTVPDKRNMKYRIPEIGK